MSQYTSLLNNEIHQRITAQLKLPEYNEDISFIAGRDSYSVYELDGESEVLQGYSFNLSFVSDEVIKVEDIVDTEAELSLRDEISPLNSKKIFGKIIEAKERGSVARKRLYEIKIVSPLYYLSLNQRYEVYQEMSVPDIISLIIAKYSVLLNIQLEVKIDEQSIPKRNTSTQYKQSDLEFIKMLCEEEGYVLLIDSSSKDPYLITLCELNEHALRNEEIMECTYNRVKSFSTSAQEQDYYENKKPSLDFNTQTGGMINAHSFADNENTAQLRTDIKKQTLRDRLDKLDESLYRDLSRYAKVDAEQGFSQGIRVVGKSEELGIKDGEYFNIKDIKGHKNTQVIILKVNYKATFPNALDEYAQITGDKKPAQYSVKFIAVPSDVIYRPEAITPKPRIKSIQTAIVSNGDKDTNKYSNEIDVNERGEIRVILHFDEKRPTSCYIPLSNIYSGDGYGAQFLPRVNSEVIVSFINGNIDRPIITGALHNGENRHPYNLPKEKTKSFIKTQTTPQYEDKEGYNELLFEDKQGEELLSLRAQNDYHLNVLHDSHTHIQNDKKTIIDNDKELSVANDSIETIGNDKKVNIVGNAITTIEKEQITTVKQDQELHILKDSNVIINNNQKTIIEQDLIQRIKGQVTNYVEKDQKEKYLTNFFMQVGAELGIEVTSSYHLNAKTIKQQAKTIELEATDGISLKCGGNVLTVDASGIHLKAATVDTNSGNGGITANKVTIPEIEKPLYNKLRVIKVTPSITKQKDLSELLTYTAEVEKYEDGAWTPTTQLTQTQENQINWYFIKNNEQDNKDILTDNPTDDTITIKGLEMSIIVEDENIYQYGHAHAFVVDADEEEGYAVTELKRQLEVINIIATGDEYKAILNVDRLTKEEETQICWTINEKDKSEFKGKETIVYDTKEEKVREILFKAYIDKNPEDAAVIIVSNDVESSENENEEVTKEEEI